MVALIGEMEMLIDVFALLLPPHAASNRTARSAIARARNDSGRRIIKASEAGVLLHLMSAISGLLSAKSQPGWPLLDQRNHVSARTIYTVTHEHIDHCCCRRHWIKHSYCASAR